MSGPLRIDTHLHMYASGQEGQWWKSGYEIWEYGALPDVLFSPDAGTLPETVAALDRGGFAHGVVLNLFTADLFRAQYEAALPAGLDGPDRARALAEFDASIPERYVAFNQWLMATLADVPTISGFVAMDPRALPPQRNVEHLRDMAERGARGVKLHPVLQKFEPDDPRMHPMYQTCTDLGLTVLSHTRAGPRRGAVSRDPGLRADVRAIRRPHRGPRTWAVRNGATPAPSPSPSRTSPLTCARSSTGSAPPTHPPPRSWPP